jgi:hypothetical protein
VVGALANHFFERTIRFTVGRLDARQHPPARARVLPNFYRIVTV